MSNKQQLQENNLDLQYILELLSSSESSQNLLTQNNTIVGTLSKTSDGYKLGETDDPFGEIETQSPLLVQLVDLVSKKYMIEGNYVWKKYIYKQVVESDYQAVIVSGGGPTSEVSVDASDSYSVDLDEGTFTLVNPESIDVNYYFANSDPSYSAAQFAGKYFVPNPYDEYIGATAREIYYGHPTEINAGRTINGEYYCTTCNAKKISISDKIFVDYVVSDTETAYPDGGAQDGYWYEKNKDILTAEKLGYTKIAVDTFTLTSNASGTKTVSHSLGDLPKFLFLLSDDTTDGYIRVYFCSYYGNEAMNIKYYNNNGNVVIYDASSISNPTWNSTQLQIFATASTKLRAGQEYTLITMA